MSRTQHIQTEILARVSGTRIVVIGDLMLDEYLLGNVDRISPEAPVPVLSVRERRRALGGAANVAHNLVGLGCAVQLLGVVGDDESGGWLRSELTARGVFRDGLLTSRHRPTTRKMRIVAQQQQIVRVDDELAVPLAEDEEHELLAALRTALDSAAAVIVSDYHKGAITPRVMQTLTEWCRARTDRIVTVDPSPRRIDLYRGCTAMTPNAKEAGQAVGEPIETEEDLLRVGRRLLDRTESQMVLITRGAAGMSLFWGRDVIHRPSVAREVFDVVGAGDTVIAVMTAVMAAGIDPISAIDLSNVAAGLVVGRFGTIAIDRSTLEAELCRNG